MKVKDTVFGSKSEYKLFRTLQNRWSKDFDLWPSLPFSSIVELNKPEPFLNTREREFFYDTNVDFTLCKKNGSPILSIEFDGLGKGYNKHGKYIQIEESCDPYRKLKLDLKLKIANNLKYPFYVISFEESKEFAPDINLTIVDGIIGQVLAKKELTKKLETCYDENRDTIESLPDSIQREYIQDLVLSAETISELENDPIAKLASKYEFEATENGIAKRYSIEYLNDPPFPKGDSFDDTIVLKKRIKLMKDATRVGCRIIISTPNVEIIETVWVRNFEDRFISPLHIANNIAELIAFKKALDAFRKE